MSQNKMNFSDGVDQLRHDCGLKSFLPLELQETDTSRITAVFYVMIISHAVCYDPRKIFL